MQEVRNLPAPCLVILVGPGASGKSTWAAERFPADAIVSSDRLRALVGASEDDLAASEDAFALLDTVLRQRLARGLTTILDTLGLDEARRRAWLALARAHGMPCVAVSFATPAEVCRARNRARTKRIPADVLTQQIRSWKKAKDLLPGEGFDEVLTPVPVRVVPKQFAGAAAAAKQQADRPSGLRFGLHLSGFAFGKQATRDAIRDIAVAAEQAGFDALYVMDHFRQIPQLGRAWEDFPESYTTLAYLAGVTDRIRLGALVTGVTYRNIAHLGKIIATLDVLSGGRAVCGLGLAWFEAEHKAYGWDFPPVPRRYELLEDALELLPLLWGKGSPAFHGRTLDVPEALCYPRPLQEHVPVIVGGNGPRTLGLAAQYADAANVLGDLAKVRSGAAVLAEQCARTGRDVALTHLTTALVGADDRQVNELVDRLRPRQLSAAAYAEAVNAGTVADQIGRMRLLADAGVSEVMLRLPGLDHPDRLAPLAEVIAAFTPR